MGSQPSLSDDDLARSKEVRRVLDDLRLIVRALRVSSRGAEKELGISGAQLFVLQRLSESSAFSLGALAERTHTDPSSVSVVVARLVERGLVRRKESPTDARRVELELTPRGRTLVRQTPEVFQAQMIGALGSLSQETLRGLSSGLGELVRAMGVEGSPRMFFEEDVRSSRKSGRRRHA